MPLQFASSISGQEKAHQNELQQTSIITVEGGNTKMVKRYKMIRVPVDVYNRYMNVKTKMELDINRFTGKSNIKMSFPKVLDAFVNPEVNHNWIALDLAKLSNFARKKR